MKRITILVSVSLMISTGLLFADKKELKKKKEPIKTVVKKRKVVIFPFYNFSGSGITFVQDYLPEKMTDELKKYSKLEIIDEVKIKNDIVKRKLSVKEIYYNKEAALQLLTDNNAEFGIIGRYIAYGKTMKINYFVISRNGKIVHGKLLEDIVDDRLLTTLEKNAQKISSWFKTNILGYSISSTIEKFEFMRNFLTRVKNSKAGKVLTNRWVVFILLILLFFVMSKSLALFIEKVIKRLTAKTDTDIDDQIVAIIKKPLKWIILILGIKFAFLSLQLKNQFGEFVNKLSMAVIVVIIAFNLSEIITIIIRAWGRKVADKIDSRIDDDLIPLFVKMSKIIVVVIGLLMALATFDVDIAPLIASLGIAGFAIGFAVKDSLANIIGGIVLILDQSFAVGDRVAIDGDVGVIKEVGLRNTKLMTYDNEIIVIPNGELMNKKFKNSVLPDPTIRVLVNFGVAYGSDIDHVEKVVLEAISKIDDICDDPAPAVVFHEMGDFSLNMQAKIWVPNYVNQYGKWIEMTKIVYKALTEAGIDIPFPTRTVYMKNES